MLVAARHGLLPCFWLLSGRTAVKPLDVQARGA
jgi:hypothetical protein